MATGLVIDDDLVLCELYNAYFSIEGLSDWHALGETDLENALQVIGLNAPELIFLDNRLPPFQDFREPLEKLIACGYQGPIMVQSACTEDDVFDLAIELGAAKVWEKWKLSSSDLAEIVTQLPQHFQSQVKVGAVS